MIEFTRPEMNQDGLLLLQAYSHENNRWYRRLIPLSDFDGSDTKRVIRAFQLHMVTQIHRELGRTRDAYPGGLQENLDFKAPNPKNWRHEGF